VIPKPQNQQYHWKFHSHGNGQPVLCGPEELGYASWNSPWTWMQNNVQLWSHTVHGKMIWCSYCKHSNTTTSLIVPSGINSGANFCMYFITLSQITKHTMPGCMISESLCITLQKIPQRIYYERKNWMAVFVRVHTNREFLDQLNNYQLLKEDP